jgi:signal transduction histidine kinase
MRDRWAFRIAICESRGIGQSLDKTMDHNMNHLQDIGFANAMMSMIRSGCDANSPSDVAWRVCGDVQKGLGLDDVILYLINEDETELLQTAAAGPKNPSGRNISNPIRIQVGSGIVGTVAKTGHSEVIGDTSKDSRYILDDEKRCSEISVPVIHSGRLIGVLDSEYISKGFYTSDHLAKMELMASVASTHLARVIAEIRLEEAHRHRNELEQIAVQQLDIDEQLGSMEKWLARKGLNVRHMLQHELRTPLNAIMAVSTLLDDICNRNSANEKELASFSGILRSNGQDLCDRITNLLELPGLSEPWEPVSTREVDIERLLQDVQSSFEDKIRERGLQLELDIAPNATTLQCDTVALRRVVSCLIDNAVKFSTHGTVLVRLLTDERGTPAEINVIDQGNGIEEVLTRRIFEPFFQVDQGMTRRHGGLGMGLPIARRLCDGMGYELRVDSRPDLGSTFSVILNPSLGLPFRIPAPGDRMNSSTYRKPSRYHHQPGSA